MVVKLEARQLMWQEGGIIMDQNGPIHLNEGIYRQLRRDYTIYYSRPMGITKDTLMAAASNCSLLYVGALPRSISMAFLSSINLRSSRYCL